MKFASVFCVVALTVVGCCMGQSITLQTYAKPLCACITGTGVNVGLDAGNLANAAASIAAQKAASISAQKALIMQKPMFMGGSVGSPVCGSVGIPPFVKTLSLPMPLPMPLPLPLPQIQCGGVPQPISCSQPVPQPPCSQPLPTPSCSSCASKVIQVPQSPCSSCASKVVQVQPPPCVQPPNLWSQFMTVQSGPSTSSSSSCGSCGSCSSCQSSC